MLNTTTEITPKDEFLQQTEYILARVVKTRDFSFGFDYVNRLLDGKKVIDSSVSVILDGMEKEWIPSEHESETFLAATVRETGLSPETIRRHTNNQWLLKSGKIPEEFKESIENAGEKSLVQIANVVKSGYELEHDDWLRFAEAAGDEQKVGKIARRIKGVPPRSNFLAITIDERGVLVAHTATEHAEFGRFDVLNDNPVVQKAIARLVGCGNVFQSVEY